MSVRGVAKQAAGLCPAPHQGPSPWTSNIRLPLALLALLLPAACAPTPQRPAQPPPLAHLPPFAQAPFQLFSRSAAVAITLGEWRLWGQRVDDSDPRTPPPPDPYADKPERDAGLWQRVGLYWFLGQNAGRKEDAWTGRHDATGQVFPREDDGEYAWSAAFISYVMRIAGAGIRFPAAPDHAAYINAGRQMSLGQTSGLVVSAEAATAYAPQPGDLICTGRAGSAGISFAALPAPRFPSHCAIVVDATPGQISVIGGNVSDSVALTHVPTTADGRLADADGVVDQRYPWFVVVRILYDTP